MLTKTLIFGFICIKRWEIYKFEGGLKPLYHRENDIN